jgi:hypothetical protein
LDAPRHLQLFSASTLRRAAVAAGLEVINLRTYSPSTMEYRESLRYFLQDWRGRREDSAAGPVMVPGGIPDQDPGMGSGYRLKGMIKTLENTLYQILNSIADRAGNGCNLFMVAKRAGESA